MKETLTSGENTAINTPTEGASLLRAGQKYTYNAKQLQELGNDHPFITLKTPPVANDNWDEINYDWLRDHCTYTIGSTDLTVIFSSEKDIPAPFAYSTSAPEETLTQRRTMVREKIKHIIKSQLAIQLKKEHKKDIDVPDNLVDFLYCQITQRGLTNRGQEALSTSLQKNNDDVLRESTRKTNIMPVLNNGIVECIVTTDSIAPVASLAPSKIKFDKRGNTIIEKAANFTTKFHITSDQAGTYTSTCEEFSYLLSNNLNDADVIHVRALEIKEILSVEIEDVSKNNLDMARTKEKIERALNFLASHETPINEELMDLVEELVKDKYLDDATKTFLTRVRRKVNHSMVALGKEVDALLENIRSRTSVPFSIKHTKLIEKSEAAIAQSLKDFKIAGNLSQKNAGDTLTKEINRTSKSFDAAKILFSNLTCAGNVLKKGSNTSADKNLILRNSLAKKIEETNKHLDNAEKKIAAPTDIIQKRDRLIAIEKFFVALKEIKSLLQEIQKSEPRSSSTEADPFLDEVDKYLGAFNGQLPDSVLKKIPTKGKNVQRAKMLANTLEHVEHAKKHLDEVDHKKLSDTNLSMRIALAKKELQSNLTFANLQAAHAHLADALAIKNASPMLDLVDALTGETRSKTTLYLTEEILKNSISKALKINANDVRFLPNKNWGIRLSPNNKPIVTHIIRECVELTLSETDVEKIYSSFFPEPTSEKEAKALLNLSEQVLTDLDRAFNNNEVLLEDASGNLVPCKTYLDYWKFTKNLSEEVKQYLAKNFYQNGFVDAGSYYTEAVQKNASALLGPLTKKRTQCVLKSNDDSIRVTLTTTRNFYPNESIASENEFLMSFPSENTEKAKALYKEYESAIVSGNYPIETITMALDVKPKSGKAHVSITGFGHVMHNQSVHQLSLKFAADNAIRKILAGKDAALDSNDWRAINQICLPYTHLTDGKITISTPPISENTDGAALFLTCWQQQQRSNTRKITPIALLEGLRTRKDLPVGPRLDLYGKVEQQKLAILKGALKTKKGKEQVAAILENNHSNQHDFVMRNAVTLAYPSGLLNRLSNFRRSRATRDVLDRLPTQALIALLKAASENGNELQTARLQKIATARLYRKKPAGLSTLAELNNLLSYLPKEKADKFKKTDRYKQCIAAENSKSTNTPNALALTTHGNVGKILGHDANTLISQHGKENVKLAPVAAGKNNTPPVTVNPNKNSTPLHTRLSNINFNRKG